MQERKLTCAIYFIYSHILLNITKYVYSKILLAAYELREYKLNYNQCYRRHTPLFYTQSMSLILRSAFSSRAIAYKSVEGYLEQVIIGNILGDAWMERKSKTSNALTNKLHRNIGLDFTMSGSFMLYGVMVLLLLLLDSINVQIQFVMSLCFLLEPFLFSPFILTFPFSLTRMETCFMWETIPVNIADYLTAVSLAFWIMDDGHTNGGLVLNTQGFTVDGVNLLVSALNTNFGLNSYMRYAPVIYIPKKDMNNVRSLVMPHMHTSTYYKLGV